MQIIGITGRSGCGKSTLTDSIRAAGFRCVDADQVAREVLLPGSPCIVGLYPAAAKGVRDGYSR